MQQQKLLWNRPAAVIMAALREGENSGECALVMKGTKCKVKLLR